MKYDVIVVGARCAGAATALLLARRGYQVLLVDKTTFPSDTISGHFILHPGTRKLAEWGLLDEVLASNCPPVNRWSTNVGDFTLSAEVPTADGLPVCVGPRRTVLDKILVDAAVAAGAELREGFAVTDLLRDGDTVVGIQGRTTQGTARRSFGFARSSFGSAVTEQAALVIGADGKRSKVAQLVQAPIYGEHASLTCWYMAYWSDFPSDALELNWRPGRLVLSFPTNDELTLIAVGWPHREFHHFRSDVEGNYCRTIQMMPDLADRLPGARRVEPYMAMADVPTFFRQPYGPGWALVGDAGHHKDPTPARGISDAFLDAALLATAVDEGLNGRQPLPHALAHYEQQRNQRAIPDNEITRQRAHLEGWDAPEMRQLRHVLRHNPREAERFFAAMALVTPQAEYFAPENIRRIMMEAQTAMFAPA